MKNFVNLYYT